MRRLILAAAFLILILATCWLWAYRFERVPGVSSHGLEDLRKNSPSIPGMTWEDRLAGLALRIDHPAGQSSFGARLVIPQLPPAEFLHLRFRLKARNLRAGSEIWEDGRFLVDWLYPGETNNPETCMIGTIRDDIVGEFQDIVVGPERGAAVPAFRVEHLGKSGSFWISDLKMEVIRERTIWKTGKWLIVALWWGWAVAFIRSWQVSKNLRPVLAAAVWVGVGVQCVIPGPWKIQRPIYPSFQLGAPSAGSNGNSSMANSGVDIPATPAVTKSGPLKPLGELPVQGSFALRLKLAVQEARPVLHMLLMFGPMLLMSLMVGIRPAWWLSVIASLGIELGQVGFGYGFGADDVGDLASDLTGILLAMWIASVVLRLCENRGWHRRIPFLHRKAAD